MNDSDVEACRWLVRALGNVKRAFIMKSEKDFALSIFFFQQATEFHIKALLVFMGAEPKRSHDPGRQLRSIVRKMQISERLETLLSLSAELSQDYMGTRYPGDVSPWDIYSEGDVGVVEEKVLETFRDIRGILKELLPKREITISECLQRLDKSPKLSLMIEEMRKYID